MRRLETSTLEMLRSRIAMLEKRPLLGARPEDAGERPEGSGILDLVAAPGGLQHEIFTDELRNGSAALGFTLGLARPLLSPARPAILYLQLARDSQELGVPYALGFGRFGIGPEKIILGRTATLTELLWATEEALACEAIAGVIADLPGNHEDIDFTVSRRLSLRATAAGTSVFLLRYGTGREASAAKLRWHVVPALSGGMEFDPQAPGPARFAVTLEKSRLGAKAQRLEGRRFLLDWVEHGFVVLERGRTTARTVQRRTPPSGALSAALGHGLYQAG